MSKFITTLREIAARIRGLFAKRHIDADLEDEFAAHLDLLAEENIRRGMPREEAHYAARREFGGMEQIKETYRERRVLPMLETLKQDLRYGARMLRKNQGFTAIAVLTLALGIGANTLVFGLAYTAFLRPLPYPSPQRLVTLWESNLQQNAPQSQVSAGNYYDWQRQSTTFSHTAAYANWRFNLTGVAVPESIPGALVSPDFFETLGVNADQGRTFTPDEDQPAKDFVAIVSQSLWNRLFGATAKLTGQTLVLNGSVATIVGVMPPSFAFPAGETEVWVALSLSEANKQNRDGRWLKVVGRLKPGISMQQARNEMNVIAARLQSSYPKSDANWNVVIVGLHEYVVGDTRTTVLVLLGSVGLLLLLTCVNVASLLLARGTARTNEIAVRFALGAGRGRLIRQLLTEGILLVTVGDLVAVLLARLVVQAIRLMRFEAIPDLQNLEINGPVIAFTIGISFLVAIIVGLVPALRTSSYQALRSGNNRFASGSGIQRERSVLVSAQIALALILLIGAGLLANSFLRLSHVNPGFQVDKRLSFRISLPRSKYKTSSQQISFFSQVLDRIDHQPGVLRSGGVSDLPLLGNRMSFKIQVDPPLPAESNVPPLSGVRWASPSYFQTIGIALRRGRLFDTHDGATAPPVAVVSQSMADRYWPARDPIGMRVRIDEDPRWFAVVGVVDDIKQETLDSTEGPALYFPYEQKSEVWLNWMSVVVHTAGDPHDLARVVREQVLSVDKDQPITELASLQEHLADSVAFPRMRMIVMSSFSLIAFCMSVVGIFGMISYSVAQRRREIGIRMALGAQAGDVVRQFLGQGMRCVLWGLMIGGLGAFLLTRALKAFLFGVNPLDALTFSSVAALILFVAAIACYIPARRATRVDPLIALRYE